MDHQDECPCLTGLRVELLHRRKRIRIQVVLVRSFFGLIPFGKVPVV